jgi:methyl coenzyme M reductase gamma subunit
MADISFPVRVTEFPDEIYRAPKSRTKRADRNLVDFNELDKGGFQRRAQIPASVELRKHGAR